MTQKSPSLFDWKIARPAIGDAFRKLNPRLMVKNPVMFVTMVGAALTTVGIFTAEPNLRGFVAQSWSIWLWFYSAVRQFCGKPSPKAAGRRRQPVYARRARTRSRVAWPMVAKRKFRRRCWVKTRLVVREAGDIIPADGDVIEGIASVDEAAIT